MAQISEEEKKVLLQADCIGVKVYVIKMDCSSCEFDESSDRFHCGFDRGGNSAAAGKPPMCRYEIEERFISLEEFLSSKKKLFLNENLAKQELDRLNYINACAIVHYDHDWIYAQTQEEIKDIKPQEAEAVVRSEINRINGVVPNSITG